MPLEVDSPERLLGLDAVWLLRRLEARRRPHRWGARAFVREVDLVRAHLIPIRDRRSLAASFGREAFHRGSGSRSGSIYASATRIAYAIRWLELGDALARPSWTELLRPLPGVEGTEKDPVASPV